MNRINFYNFRQLWLGACCLLFAAASLNAQTTVNCGTTLNETYCYGNNDLTLFSYTSNNGDELVLAFNAGGMEICCDDIIVYDGPDANSPILFQGNNGGNLAGLSFASTGSSISFQIDSDFSVSCQAGSACCTSAFDWDVVCSASVVLGCTDPDALNFNPDATIDDGSCAYPLLGCTTPNSLNYNPSATDDDGSCIPGPGCGAPVHETLCYGNNADVETYYAPASGSFEMTIYFLQGTVESATFDQLVIYDGDNTGAPILYQNPVGVATQLDGLEVTSTQGNGLLITLSTDGSVSCQTTGTYNEWVFNVFCSDLGGGPVDIPGCTDPTAINYNPDATVDDGSCEYDMVDVPGCTDPTALNYNPNATVDDGSCEYDMPALAFCDGAISVACNQPYEGSTSGADVQSEAPDCGTSVTAPGVWHSYIGTGRNTEINTCGSGFDTKLTIVTADCETGAIECVGANDDACGLQSSVTFPAAFGQTYYILVHGFGTGSGDYVLNVVCGIPTTVLGCTDPSANNYNPLANQDDGSCEYDTDQPCLSTRLWPTATFTPTCTGSPQSITTGAWADEYSRVNVIAGTEYTFSSSVATDYITISDNDNNQVYLFGTGPQTWTATFTGVVRFHTHLDADCTRQNTSRTRSVACGAIVVAPNADCGSAEPIACGDLIFGSTADGLIADLPNCGTSITSKGVWYSFPGTGNPVTVSTCGSSFDTKLSVFAGICGGEFVCVGGNDDACGLQSEVELRFTQLGATYYVLVHGFGSATGDFELSLECVVPGCTDPIAFNYNPDANVDDGSCAYPPNPVLGCTDPAADNYDPSATQNDGSCVYPSAACLDADNGQWPASTFTPSCPGGPQSITTCGFGSEYSKVNVLAGNTYGFASSVGTDHISISDENGNTAYAAGTSPVVWTATFTGVVRFYTHLDDTCPITDGGCRTKLVGCMVAPLQAPNTQTAAPAQADRLRVFPNPATTELNVDLSAFIGAPATIFIHNSLGQTLQMRQIDEVQTTLERFDLNQLQAGMYFINVQVEGRGQFTERVIVNGNR